MKNNFKYYWNRYAGVGLSFLFGLFILIFGGFRDKYVLGYVFGGLLLAWGIVSLFTKDTKVPKL